MRLIGVGEAVSSNFKRGSCTTVRADRFQVWERNVLMLHGGQQRRGTYTIISGDLNEEDMVVAINGENYLVVLRPEPGMPCDVFGYYPGSDVPDSEPAGVWDPRGKSVGLWDDYGAVAAWYAYAGGRRPPVRTPVIRDVRSTSMTPVHRSAVRLAPDVYVDDPILEVEPALFTLAPHTSDASMCYDLVFTPPNHGGSEADGYTASTSEPLNNSGITWAVDRRSGRVYVRDVDESLLPTDAIPALATSHSRARMIEGCYLLAVNRKSARLMSPEMVDALMLSAGSDDTRRGVKLTFQTQPKVSQQDSLYINPRLMFADFKWNGTIWLNRTTGRPAQIRRAGLALDVEICAATASQPYRVTEDVFLALRRRRLLCSALPSSDYTLTQEDYQERWARSLRELRKERGIVEVANRHDKYSHKNRDHNLHFHGSQPPGWLQCGSRRGRAEAGKTVAYRRRFAARHLKGRAFHIWDCKTLYSMRVKRYCRHADFRTKRHCFHYWLDVTIDWMKKGSGGRRELPPEEMRRRQEAEKLPPDTVKRLRKGAATQVAQGLKVWEYRLLSFYFDKLRRLHSDELCRWMNSYRMRRVLEAWYTYAASNPIRQTASGGIFGRVAVPERAVGELRELRSSRPSDSWSKEPAALGRLYPHQGRFLSRWHSPRDTSLTRIQRLQERRERLQPRRIEAAHLALLSCGSAEAGGNAPSYSSLNYNSTLHLG